MDSVSINNGIDEHKLRNINQNILEESKLYPQTAPNTKSKIAQPGEHARPVEAKHDNNVLLQFGGRVGDYKGKIKLFFFTAKILLHNIDYVN